MNKDWRSIVDSFIDATSYSMEETEYIEERFKTNDRNNRPETYLTYENAIEKIKLDKPEFLPVSKDIWNILESRRSKRNFIDAPLSLQELNLLLWGSAGITQDLGDYQLRTAPSAGALYPIETFLIINNVESLKKGLYHLNVKEWCLEALVYEDLSKFSYEVTHNQKHAEIAGVNFIWTAVVDRTRAKYYERAYRYVFWDVGHTSQNLNLAATALGLGSVTMGHWFDKELNEMLGIDGRNHFSILFSSVGKTEGDDWQKDRRIKTASS